VKRLIPILLLFSVSAFADISFVDSTNTNATGQTSRTGTEPTGTAENDLVIALGSTGNQFGMWSSVGSFTEIDNIVTSTGAASHLYLGRIIRGSSAPSYQFDYSGAAAAMSLTLVSLRGIDTSAPLDVTYVQGSHYMQAQNTPNTAARAITTATDGAWVLLMCQMGGNIDGSAGPPDTYTEHGDFLTGAATIRGHYVASKLISPAGTETPGVFTHADTLGNGDPRCFTLAIKPAVVATSAAAQRRRMMQ
jgi:hypothetical protein